jgi:hypothetical protein
MKTLLSFILALVFTSYALADADKVNGQTLASGWKINGQTVAGTVAGITLDMLQTFETDTFDATSLNGTDNTSVGTWVAGASMITIQAGAQMNMVSQVNGGTVGGTRGVQRDYTSSTYGYVDYDMGSGATQPRAVIVFCWKYSGNPGVSKRLVYVGGTGGDVCRVDFLYSTDYIGLNGGTNVGAAAVAGTEYWIILDAVQNGTCTLRVLNKATGVQLGSDATVTGGNYAVRNIRLSWDNAETADSGITFSWDNLGANWTAPTFPIGP